MLSFHNTSKSSSNRAVMRKSQEAIPLVSVVMPALNQADFIEQAIRSVLVQETDFPVELVVMDGGSTDGTQRILSELSLEMSGRLRWFSESDLGPSHAINKAIKLTRGEIIGWLNADDLYAKGAILRAIKMFQKRSDWFMVYGHGQHINACGKHIGDYPTLLPDTPFQSFSEGCFICQPTVFFRKEVLDSLGGLDESLSASFDFDLWMRLFGKYPRKIGFVDHVQAFSRLHGGCITVEQRETVAYEGMKVTAKYLGTCPLDWFKTYLDEVLSNYPHGRQINDVRKHVKKFARKIHKFLSLADQKELTKLLKSDARIQLATPDACLDVYPDGWLARHARLRVRDRKSRWKAVSLKGEYVKRNDTVLCLTVHSPDGTKCDYYVEEKGKFDLHIKLSSSHMLPTFWELIIESKGGFIPRDVDKNSDDRRELICKIDSVKLIA